MIKRMEIMFLLFVMASCVDSSSLDYLSSITESEGSSNNMGRKRSTRSLNQCEDFERCKNICDQMLDYSSERGHCYKLSLKKIGQIEEVFDVLKEEPLRPDKLKNVSGRDFEVFASVALSSWSDLIRGQYRKDQKNDNDDRDKDDVGRSAYETGEAENVLKWIIDNKAIAEAILDFSGNKNHILADLLVRINFSFSCGSKSGDDKTICDALDLSTNSLSNGEKSILQGIKHGIHPESTTTYLKRIVSFRSSQDEVSAIYELTHDMLSRICKNVNSIQEHGREHGRERSYKLCLSWIYFCPLSVSVSVYGDQRNHPQIDQYLLRNTYRKFAESSLTECKFLTTEPKWSDYWD